MAKRMMVASANPPSRMYKILFLSKLEPEEGCYVSLWLTFNLFVPGQCSRTSPRPHYLLYIHKCQSLLQRLLQSEDCSSALPQSHCRPLSSARPVRPTQPRHDPKLSDCCCPRLPLCTQALPACPLRPSVPGRILVGGCCFLVCSVHRWRKDDWFSD